MDKLESDVLLLIERCENFKDQLNRFVSHLESEQRVTGNISKRVDEANYLIKSIDDICKKHERILLNEGKGISYRIDRLERMQDNRKTAFNSWFSVLSLLISLMALLVMIFK